MVDVRNHGQSDHHKTMDYPVLANDIIRVADKIRVEKFTILGHSMGGKIAMTVATKYPGRVDGVISIDSAPFDYNSNDRYTSVVKNIARKLGTYDIVGMHRKDLLAKMIKDFDSKAIAFLLLNNAEFNNDLIAIGWKSNVPDLLKNTDTIFGFENVGQYYGPFKAILAGNSKFEARDFNKSFPNVTDDDLTFMQGAGHWVHSDKPHETIEEIK